MSRTPPPLSLRPAIGLAIGLAFAGSLAAQTTKPSSFAADHQAVQQLMQKSLWVKAKTALTDLLARHEKSVEAIATREALVEDMRRCSLGATLVAPKPETLTSGKVLGWNQSTGRLKILYTPDTMGDFERDPNEPDAIQVHPAAFRGDYTVTWRGTQLEGQHFGGACELGSATEYLFDFGSSESGGSWFPARLEELSPTPQRADRSFGALDAGPFTASLRVTKKSLELLVGEKKTSMAKIPRADQPFGHFGFWPSTAVHELVIEGDVEPSWLQGLADAHMAKQAAAFDETWKPKQALPAWLFTNPEGKRTPPKWRDELPRLDEVRDQRVFETVSAAMNAGNWAAAASALATMRADAMSPVTADLLRAIVWTHLGLCDDVVAACDRALSILIGHTHLRLLRAGALSELRRSDEAAAELRATVAADPGERVAYESLVIWLLQRGKVAEAEDAVRRAKIDHGLWNDMKSLDQLLLMRSRGPAWQRRFVHVTSNYEIASDIDLRTCQAAGQILEASLSNLKAQLAWTQDAKKGDRFRVFLFSGEAGYHDYCNSILGSAPSHTAGLYTPVLKQLLIWNLPKREEMERTIRHEGFHQFLDRVVDSPPVWFNEGMAEFWETAQREKGRMRGGQIRRDHITALLRARDSLPKLDRFLRGSANDFYANAHLRYPQAWAFVHFLRLGPREYQERFAALWKELRGTGSIERALATAFANADWATVERDFWSHLTSLK